MAPATSPPSVEASSGRPLDFLEDVFRRHAAREAIVWRDESVSYGAPRTAWSDWSARLAAEGVRAGDAVGLEADFSQTAVACLLALVERGNICVPLSASLGAERRARFCETAEVATRVRVRHDDAVSIRATPRRVRHPLLRRLAEAGRPGLVLFSSGSTGESKAAVHDLVPLLAKYRVPRHARRILSFLLFDHIGDDTWIGANAVVMDDVGEGAVVGAGSVVTAPVADYTVVAGSPAALVRSRR